MSAKKIIIIGLLIAILELLAGVLYINLVKKEAPKVSKTPPSGTGFFQTIIKQPETTTTPSAIISFNSDKKSLRVLETVNVTVLVEVLGTSSDASDLTIKYDKDYLIPTKNPKAVFELGNAYEKLVFNQADLKLGIATMSAISEVSHPFKGKANLGIIQFKALKPGETKIKVEFQPGSTRDSNVVDEGKDILTSVSDLSLQISP